MNADKLFDAMRYGAPKRANLKSLGKFGLGLKTASSSICKKFSIVSKDTSESDFKAFLGLRSCGSEECMGNDPRASQFG